MKNVLLAATLVAGGALAGATLTSTLAHPAAAATPNAPPGPWAPPGPGADPRLPPPGPWGQDGHAPFRPDMRDHHDDAAFSLFAHVDNKNLSAADVRVIAQAALLEHGNHSWTVTGINPAGQNIDFSYATPHGDIIATFAIDPATGHIHRIS